jgi:acetolactate synthase-1/2/3 large subunit
MVRAVGEFDEALAAALAERVPSLLEVDMTAVGPMPTPFVPPLPIP